jgi:2-(1,2-epoxy-1,2-dihydrophenyl)acetyl-CoA isomerase
LHDRVRVEYRTDRVAWVVLEPGDEPMNSFTAPVVDAMREGVEVAAERARVVVLRGEGQFAVGADLRHIRDQSPESRSAAVDGIVSASNELVTAIRAAPALVVAAVTGVAAGGGFGFALACDLVVAHDEAVFDAAYARIGLTPDNATPFYLARLLGPYRAREVLFSPDPLSAEDARDLGLVAAIYGGSPETFDDEVAVFAERFARHPSALVGETKALIDSAFETGLEDHLALEREAVVTASGTDRFAEGIDAFFDRRDPDWA